MNRILIFLISFFTFSHFYSQNQNLTGNWILVKTLFNDGKNIEVNNSNYSTKLIYAIKKNSIRINNQYFESVFTNDKIKTPFRTINYTIKDRYLIAQDEGDNKTSYFLKVDDYIQKFPEFKLKEVEKNGKIL